MSKRVSEGDDYSYESLAVPPGAVFVVAGESLLVLPSTSAAESLLKSADVAEGAYPTAFGPNGEIYCIRCEAKRVLIERTGEPGRPDELKELLLRHLEACEDPADATQPLADIVAISWSIERDFWLRNDPYGDRFGTSIPVWGCAAVLLAVGALWYFGFR